MQGYYIKKVGEHRGSPRVWLEGSQTERAGFTPGQRYDIEVQGQMVVLQANKDGSRVVSGKVIGERSNPVIDINSKALLAMFDGMAAIRVVVKKDQIYLMPLASEIKKRERFQRLRAKLENGDPLEIGSLSHGGGVLTHAIHSGLAQAGIKSHLAFANEIRGELLEHAAVHNDAWSDDTQVLAAPMQELAFDGRGVASIPKVDIMEISLPCSGQSKAGRSKRGLANPEAHPEVGHLVVSALIIVNQANPAILILENVVEMAASATADILRNQLRDLGYHTQERMLNGKIWGALENRNRWCMVAITDGVEFNFDQLQPPLASPQLIGDVLDKTIGPDDPRWRDFAYLKTKELRDAAKGSSFSMQVVTPESDKVNVLRKGYSKGGSTDPLLQHPENPDLLRQFSVSEHCSIKKVPQSLVAGLSNTIGHQVLGQSIVYPPFAAVGAHLGDALNQFVGRPGRVRPVVDISHSSKVVALSEYELGVKYNGIIPEIRFLPLSAIERQEMDFRPEVMDVSSEVANNMDFSEPIDVTAFRYGKDNNDSLPVVMLQDGHHRTAAALQTGRAYLPVTVKAINAKGEKLNALIGLSLLIENELLAPEPVLVASVVKKVGDQQLLFADTVVNAGSYSGLVLSVEGEIATQKVNRDGATVQHDLKVLTMPVAAGDIVEIKYAGGLGVVGGKGAAMAVGQ